MAQEASGLASWQRDTDHIEKAFDFAGMPARNGVTAALPVQAGGNRRRRCLLGRGQFLPGVPMHDPSMLMDKLGERYEIARTSVKKWTVGSPIQAPLDALANLIRKHHFEAAILRQRAKVQLVKDAELERLMPRREAVVEVTLTDGKVASDRVGNVRGTAENSTEELSHARAASAARRTRQACQRWRLSCAAITCRPVARLKRTPGTNGLGNRTPARSIPA